MSAVIESLALGYLALCPVIILCYILSELGNFWKALKKKKKTGMT